MRPGKSAGMSPSRNPGWIPAQQGISSDRRSPSGSSLENRNVNVIIKKRRGLRNITLAIKVLEEFLLRCLKNFVKHLDYNLSYFNMSILACRKNFGNIEKLPVITPLCPYFFCQI